MTDEAAVPADAAAAAPPPAKRLKTLGAPLQPDVIRASLLAPDSAAALRAAHDASGPYTHVVLKDLAEPDLLRKVRDEVINNVQATYKETDLFKVFQTGDLANLDELDPASAAKLPSLMKLRDALYSQEFRAFVQAITGCGELSDKTDCSCNVYAKGGHLLVHDDVIGTRRVSYIIYLTDPDKPWAAEDGGALELYPCVDGEAHTPAVAPTTSHLPLWNSMAMFVVQPGRSFHSVQEVLTGDKPRFSISGWYHAPAEPQGKETSSLQQLQMAPGQDCVRDHAPFEGPGQDCVKDHAPFAGGNADEDLTKEELAHLRRWVNPAYLDPKAWDKVQKRFEENGSVQLQRFLLPEVAEPIVAAGAAADAAQGMGRGRMPDHAAGCSDGWEPVGPPHKQRYLRFSAAALPAAAAAEAPAAEAGRRLAEAKRELFESRAFGKLLRALTTIDMLGHAGEVRRMRPGLDYTVAHYGVITRDPRLDCVLTFVDDREEADAADWGVGEVGGFEAYLLAEDDKEGAAAADTYRQDAGDESGVINVPAAANSLNLLLRDAGLMRFVKYVSAAAPGSRWDIAMEYLPEDDGEEPEDAAEDQPPAAAEGEPDGAANGAAAGEAAAE